MVLNRTQRAILRLLLQHKDGKVSTLYIAKRVEINQKTAMTNLRILENKGYVESFVHGKIRKHKEDNMITWKAPPKILWKARYQ